MLRTMWHIDVYDGDTDDWVFSMSCLPDEAKMWEKTLQRQGYDFEGWLVP